MRKLWFIKSDRLSCKLRTQGWNNIYLYIGIFRIYLAMAFV
jgi:hypothetical protein